MDFVKESLAFTGEDSPMATLMLSVMDAFAEFERSLIRERQREGIALAKQRGAYKGRKKTSHRNGQTSWSSGPAAAFQKLFLPAITGSAGRRSTSIYVKPGGPKIDVLIDDGAVHIRDVLATVAVAPRTVLEAGDHELVLLEVTHLHRDETQRPLVFFDSTTQLLSH